jgi:hypothetical protein
MYMRYDVNYCELDKRYLLCNIVPYDMLVRLFVHTNNCSTVSAQTSLHFGLFCLFGHIIGDSGVCCKIVLLVFFILLLLEKKE